MSDVAARKPSTASQPIYDLVYDPSNLTIRSSIPNIPEPGTFAAVVEPTNSPGPNVPPWTRVEALNVHHRLLSTYIETRSRPLEMERTCKTSRGWWVVWLRLPSSSSSPHDNKYTSNNNDNTPAPKEAFLIRKASDYVSSSSAQSRSASGSGFFRDLSGALSSSPSPSLPVGEPTGSSMGPRKLVEGVGIDPRRYIESLLSLNR